MRYEWFVPDTAGPASRDGPVVAYAYVSGVDHIKHINAGGQQCQAVGQETGSEVIIKPGCCVGPTHRGAAFVVFWKLMCAAALCVVATDLVDCRPRACALARPAHYCRLTCTCCASGLVGPLAIYAKGKLDEPGVDREIPLLFNIQNEMQSIYFQVGSGSVVCCVKTPARTRTLFCRCGTPAHSSGCRSPRQVCGGCLAGLQHSRFVLGLRTLLACVWVCL